MVQPTQSQDLKLVNEDATALLGLEGVALVQVELQEDGARVVHMATADESAAACSLCGVISTAWKGLSGRPDKPFHVVRLAGDALDSCRRRVQPATCGHRGRKGDPLYRARRTLHTGAGLLTDRQRTRLEDLFAVEEHVPVEANRGIYQRMIAAYREKDRALGRVAMEALIDAVGHDVPAGLTEVRKLGRTLNLTRATGVRH